MNEPKRKGPGLGKTKIDALAIRARSKKDNSQREKTSVDRLGNNMEKSTEKRSTATGHIFSNIRSNSAFVGLKSQLKLLAI